ncbi:MULTISPECIES: DUF2971 domain-containing protein [Methanobacterium]|uniref:DUF2971 domain-containing protein n=1 Tax=Methanobacterium bryantii TaxID=2161 RepID=A0A2A2H7F9_METBR|nr:MULTISPECIES: DUF2971 domain-containing protein [Methanobacterium]OEC87342.1 hypothetical protein A9507_07610 [Methanobacterium sp. A39]PAV05318.1 hypothetical protein ASJ80_09920 [Methanobacterium bryantii]
MWKDELEEILFSGDPSKINAKKAIDLKYSNIPTSLYKYGKFDGKSLNSLENDEIWLSNPQYFNDPFDCAYTVPKKLLTNEYIKQNLEIALSGLEDYTFTEEEKDKLKTSETIIYDIELMCLEKDDPENKITPDERAKIAKEMEKSSEEGYIDVSELRKGIFITCFSETNKSILMWSHYANDHQGFCVEYDFKELGRNNQITRFLFPVIYTNKIFDGANFLDSVNGEMFNNVLVDFFDGISELLEGRTFIPKFNFNNMGNVCSAINKCKDWEYEKEWRYVCPFGLKVVKPKPIKVPKPKAIYLGAMVCKENCKKILEIGRERNIDVYKMNMEPSEFALGSNKIHECSDIPKCE